MHGAIEVPLPEFIREGDIVYYGRNKNELIKVTRVKQVKFLGTVSGSGRRIEGRLEYAHKASNPEDFVVAAKDQDVEKPDLGLGMAVRFRDPSPRTAGVFVTLNVTAAGWKLARLGGKDGLRYFHSIEAERLVPVDEINNANWA